MRLSVTDLDRNGLVDGSEKSAYQIYDSAGAPLLITKKSGRTISEQSSSKWSVLASAPSRKGHLVLIANNRSKKSKYRIWSVNRKGIVRSKGQWELSRSLSRQGFEDIFAIDFNTDGLIEGKVLSMLVMRILRYQALTRWGINYEFNVIQMIQTGMVEPSLHGRQS